MSPHPPDFDHIFNGLRAGADCTLSGIVLQDVEMMTDDRMEELVEMERNWQHMPAWLDGGVAWL